MVANFLKIHFCLYLCTEASGTNFLKTGISTILCLMSRTIVTSALIPDEGACYGARNLRVSSRVQKGTPVFTHKGCVLQRESSGAKSDVTVFLGMRQCIALSAAWTEYHLHNVYGVSLVSPRRLPHSILLNDKLLYPIHSVTCAVTSEWTWLIIVRTIFWPGVYPCDPVGNYRNYLFNH